jgi:hypothetical protein
VTQYQRDKLDEWLAWGVDWIENQENVSSNDFYVLQDEKLWMVSLMLQLMSEKLNLDRSDMCLYLYEKSLPSAPLNGNGLEIAGKLLHEIEKFSIGGVFYYQGVTYYYSNIEMIKKINIDLENSIGHPLNGQLVNLFVDYFAKYMFPCSADFVKFSLNS